LFVAAVILVAAPFAVSSYYIDKYGIDVEGKVDHKSEYIGTRRSGWTRTNTVTVEYWPPDGAGIAFFNTTLDPDAYDTFKKGQRVTIHYLRQRDLPRIPLAHALGEMRILPVARLAGRTFFSPFEKLSSGPARRVLEWIVAAVILLAVWRYAGWPRFAFAAGGCVAVALIAILIDQFPRPTPAPSNNVLHASGRVVSLNRIDRIFSGSRSRGMDAEQPVQVVGIEFVPAGRSEPVVAADLIDADSLPGLKRDAIFPLDYEASSPRTAHLQAATRNFPSRNLRGMMLAAVLSIAVVLGFFAFTHWLGQAWKRLLARR
jgi:hypothetical protein